MLAIVCVCAGLVCYYSLFCVSSKSDRLSLGLYDGAHCDFDKHSRFIAGPLLEANWNCYMYVVFVVHVMVF